ncbi:MAG: glutamine--fructose-6-phosphate transaminase (isomerizing) [bacterium]|nr:glutamine--fructose-6-phosphate transaminase (isomerizing) [bacterium]
MCGIIGYVGRQRALPIILDGLKNMEYRGYDSSGVAIKETSGKIKAIKAVGPLLNLEEKISDNNFEGSTGIGHVRWATHGGVTEKNSHPHMDCKRKIWVVHNGIIENYQELKAQLLKKGHKFQSETDTEVLAHLIEEKLKTNNYQEAVRLALKEVRGTYGVAVLNQDEPEKIIAARNFSPLLLGVGEGECFVASDASAILKHTTKVVYLDDGELAVLTPKGHAVYDLGRNLRDKKTHHLEWSLEKTQKNGFPHFMLKEIFEQPEAIANSIRGRLLPEEGLVKLGASEDLKKVKRILIAACGTAYLSGKVGEYMLEEYAGIPVEVDLASEFRYRKPVFQKGDAFLVISQSGETADTLAALREAKEKNVLTLGVVNVIGSTLAREAGLGVYQHIGPEIGVASTKAFTSQLTILALLTILFGRSRDMSVITGQRIVKEIKKIPHLIQTVLKQDAAIKKLAKKYNHFNNFLYLGRKYNLPIAYEGALKLKEISYVHAEGYGAGEMKHGPIAMIDENLPSIFIVPQDSVYEKTISNIEEVRARKGPIIAIATEGDKKITRLADDVIYIPKTLEMLTPILSVVPLQLFAYHFGVARGYNVDRPRNLAKSVTVE